jgi:hypothetical protein
LASERVIRIAVVSGAADIGGLDEEETAEELAAELGEEARILREDPEEWYAGFVAAVPEVDRRCSSGRRSERSSSGCSRKPCGKARWVG